MKRLAAWFAGIGIGMVLAGTAGAATLVLPRAGQVGIAVVGDFGSLANTGVVGREFGSGFGVGVRLRYRMRYERGLGLTFDQYTLDSRVLGYPAGAFNNELGPADSLLTRDELNLTTTGIELYQFFGTRNQNVRWLSLGAGLAQISARLSSGEIQYPIGGDGTFLSAAGGVEHYVYRSWAVDFSARYQAIFLASSVNHNLQASAGIIFYAAY